MFEGLKNQSVLNVTGLYTQKQMDEKDKRVKELWEALNESYSALVTYVSSIEQMYEDTYSFGGREWTKEEKKAYFQHCCNRLREVAKLDEEVMFKR